MAKAGEMDFSALRAQAQVELDKEPSTEAIVAKEEKTEVKSEVKTEVEPSQKEPVQKEVETEVKTAEEKAQEVFDLPDTAKVKVKIDGEEQIVSYKDYKDILRKNATITQRFQEFSKSKTEFNDLVQRTLVEIEAREKALQEQSQKKDPLYETILNALKGQMEPKPRDPNEIVTLADIEQERSKLMKDFEAKRLQDRSEFEQTIAQAAQEVQTRAQVQRERQAYLNGLNDILGKDNFKVLKDVIPNLEANVMFHVQQMGPQNLEEALEFSQTYIAERAEALSKLTTAKEQLQQKEAVKQKMESNDGATLALQGKTKEERLKQFVGKSGKLNWDALAKDALVRANAMS